MAELTENARARLGARTSPTLVEPEKVYELELPFEHAPAAG